MEDNFISSLHHLRFLCLSLYFQAELQNFGCLDFLAAELTFPLRLEHCGLRGENKTSAFLAFVTVTPQSVEHGTHFRRIRASPTLAGKVPMVLCHLLSGEKRIVATGWKDIYFRIEVL